MSWQDYITHLQRPDKQNIVHVREAAIWGATSGSVSSWASTAGEAKNITQEEVLKLLGDRSSFSCNGPFVAGHKCMLIRDHLDLDGSFSMDLKTKGTGDDHPFPICVARSKNALIIAFGSKTTGSGPLLDMVYGTANYLRSVNM